MQSKSTRLRALIAAAVAVVVVSLGLAGTASARSYYYVVNAHSGKVLMPQGESKAWGTTVVQDRLRGVGAQHWFVTQEGDYAGLKLYSFENRWSHLCIHPSDWSGANGTVLLQASCSNASSHDARSWAPIYPSNGYDPLGLFHGFTFAMFNRQTYQYAGIAGASMSAGVPAVQLHDYYDPSARWQLIYGGETL